MAINPIPLLRRSVRVSWEHLGQLALTNLLFVLLSLTVVGMPAAFLGLSFAGRRLHSGLGTSPGEFLQAAMRRFSEGLALGLIYFLILFLIVLNLNFYGGNGGLWWGARVFLRGIIVFIGLFFLLSAVYSPALLVTSNLGPLQALRAGALLVIDNPVLTLFAFGLVALWWLVSLPTVLLFFLFGFSVPAVFLTLLTAELVRSYDEEPVEAEP